MTDPSWFFSTLAQSIASIVGLIIAIGTVIYQLDRTSRRNRTNKLRNKMRDLQNEYKPAVKSSMDLLKQPYDDPINVDINRDDDLSVDKIEQLVSKENEEYDARKEVWMYCNYILNLLDRITEESEESGLFLLSEHELNELLKSSERVANLIYKGENTVQTSIEQNTNKQNISVQSSLFNPEDTDYINMNSWFDQHFNNYDQERCLDGTDLLSISNLFNELQKELQLINIESKHSSLKSGIDMKKMLIPTLLLLLFGVITPIITIIEMQTEFHLPLIDIVCFQIILISICLLLFAYIILILSNYI